MEKKSSKAGRKSDLANSASYPRPFGLAVAGLIGKRGEVPLRNEPIDLWYDGYGDDLRALDDILLGKERTWWRKL